MERVSSKHGPRLDDQQKHEEHALLHGEPDEGRTEGRTTEDATDEEPSAAERDLDLAEGDLDEDADDEPRSG